MKTFNLTNGQAVAMSVITGEVIESSQTQTMSVLQGDPTILTKDIVVPGQISSRTDVKTELWLRLKDGKEQAFPLRNFAVPVRAGHRASVLWAKPVGRDRGWYIGMRNHETGVSKVAPVSALGDDAAYFKLDAGGNLVLLAIFAAFIALGVGAGMVMSDSREIAQRIVVGGLFGFLFWMILIIPISNIYRGSRVGRATQEIQAIGDRCLTEQDKA